MDKRDAINIARQYAQAVKTHYGAGKVFLFGSYAKGNYHADSDIDVAVIFDDYEDGFHRDVELMVMGYDIDVRIEPHAFRESEFVADDPLAYEVMKYGRVELTKIEGKILRIR